jgi:hypothetical protein
VFDFVEELYDGTAIECEVAKLLNKPVGFWWNDNVCSFGVVGLDNGICVVTLVNQNAGCASVFQRGFCMGAVGDVSGRKG